MPDYTSEELHFYKNDNSQKSTPTRIPGAGQIRKISSTTKIKQTKGSPSKIPTSSSGSRIPTLLSSPSKNQLQSSSESLDELEWDGNVRRSMTSGEDFSVADLTPPSSSSSSCHNSPQKRTRSRDGNVRTSPDGESIISPSKSRRGGSPSKIPVAGSYLGLRGSSEDILSLAQRHKGQNQVCDCFPVNEED